MIHVSNGVEPRSVAPDHQPLEQLQWRHMGVMASQINWSVLDRTTNKYCEWNPPVSRGFSSQRASNGENSRILPWGTIMMRTHYQQQCWRHHGYAFRLTLCQWNPPVTVGYPRNWSVMFNHPPSSSWQQFDTTWCSCDVTIMIHEQSTSMC